MTPPPHTSHIAMSHTIGTSFAIDDTHDDASTLHDTTVPLGELLGAHIAKAKETETTKIMNHLLHLVLLLGVEYLMCPIHLMCLMRRLIENSWLMMVLMV